MHETLDPVELASLRADKHWYDDGLPSLLRGTFLLVLAFSLTDRANHQSAFHSILAMTGNAVAYFFLFMGNRWLLERIKARLTYPRASYTPAPPDRKPADAGFFWPPIPSAREIEVVNRRETIATWAGVGWMLFFFVPAVLGGEEWRWRVPVISMPLAAILWFERPKPNASILAPLVCIAAGLVAWLAEVSESQVQTKEDHKLISPLQQIESARIASEIPPPA
jgi:hypothetical protein